VHAVHRISPYKLHNLPYTIWAHSSPYECFRFVGYFCIAAGIGLGINRDIGSISSCALLCHDLVMKNTSPCISQYDESHMTILPA
jgi:hypothetical protein